MRNREMYTLLAVMILLGVAVVTAVFTSDDIDELCSTDQNLLFRNGSWNCYTAYAPITLETYDAEPSRGAESNMHGGLVTLTTAAIINSGTNATVNQGIGKMVMVIKAGVDTTGTLHVQGKQIDRNDGSTTSNYMDNITLAGTSTDSSTTDNNSNAVHNFTDAYITNVWFTGPITFHTSDLDLSDVDVHHVSFEQFNDQDGTILETLDANLLVTNANAEFDAYLFKLTKDTDDTVNIEHISELHVGALGETGIANRYYRLRKSNLNEAINGTKDGVWLDVHYSNSPAYVEDVTIKIWGKQEVSI